MFQPSTHKLKWPSEICEWRDPYYELKGNARSVHKMVLAANNIAGGVYRVYNRKVRVKGLPHPNGSKINITLTYTGTVNWDGRPHGNGLLRSANIVVRCLWNEGYPNVDTYIGFSMLTGTVWRTFSYWHDRDTFDHSSKTFRAMPVRNKAFRD